MSESVKPEAADGRRARSERSKQAIIDATLALMEEGNLIPTAQQISDKAGVGIRSFKFILENQLPFKQCIL